MTIELHASSAIARHRGLPVVAVDRAFLSACLAIFTVSESHGRTGETRSAGEEKFEANLT